MDFSSKQKDLCQRCTMFLETEIPPSRSFHFRFIHFIYLRRVALREKPFFKGPSIKNFIIITRIPKKATLI